MQIEIAVEMRYNNKKIGIKTEMKKDEENGTKNNCYVFASIS